MIWAQVLPTVPFWIPRTGFGGVSGFANLRAPVGGFAKGMFVNT